MRWVGWLCGALLVAAMPVSTGQSGPVGGPIFVETVLVVGPGETLTVAAGASITGPGRVEVYGSLDVLGEPGRRVEIAVPILLAGNATSHLRDARFWSVAGGALTVRSGFVELDRVSFEGNGVGLGVTGGDAVVRGADLVFRAHASEGVRILAPATVDIERAAFHDNLRGIVVDLRLGAAAVAVRNGTFERNGEHILVDLGSGRAAASVIIEGNDIGSVSGAAARLPSVATRSDLPAGAPAAPERIVALAGNRIHDGDVGLRAEGGGYRVESRNDSFDGNRVGVSVAGANVTLRGARLNSTERDIEGGTSPDVLLAEVTFVPAATLDTAAPPPAGLPRYWLAAPLGLAAVAMGGAWFVHARRRNKTASRDAPRPAGAFAAPQPPLELSPIEARILRDVAANPGTAQAAVALRLGVTRQALHYHVKKLDARGLLAKTPQGRETRCSLPPGVAARLPAATIASAVTQPEALEKG